MNVLYLTYERQLWDFISIYMRATQLYNILKTYNIKVKLGTISSFANIKNSVVIIIKPLNYYKYKALIDNNNTIYFDILDTTDTVDANLKYLNKIHGAIFSSEYISNEYARHFKYPEQCKVIYHHWDDRFRNFKLNSLNTLNILYHGIPDKAYMFKQIKNITFKEIWRAKELNLNEILNYNCHYFIRPDVREFNYGPLTKISTAAALNCPVISLKNNEVELLTDDYPYYVSDRNIVNITQTIEKIQNTYLGNDWKLALEIMEHVKNKTDILNTSKQYLTLINNGI